MAFQTGDYFPETDISGQCNNALYIFFGSKQQGLAWIVGWSLQKGQVQSSGIFHLPFLLHTEYQVPEADSCDSWTKQLFGGCQAGRPRSKKVVFYALISRF